MPTGASRAGNRRGNRGAHQRIAANFDACTGWIHRWLEEARGRLPADLDLHGLSRFILTMMEGAVMQSRTHGSLQPFDQSVAQLRDYFRRLGEEAERTAANQLHLDQRGNA
jgi:hypothetical protein